MVSPVDDTTSHIGFRPLLSEINQRSDIYRNLKATEPCVSHAFTIDNACCSIHETLASLSPINPAHWIYSRTMSIFKASQPSVHPLIWQCLSPAVCDICVTFVRHDIKIVTQNCSPRPSTTTKISYASVSTSSIIRKALLKQLRSLTPDPVFFLLPFFHPSLFIHASTSKEGAGAYPVCDFDPSYLNKGVKACASEWEFSRTHVLPAGLCRGDHPWAGPMIPRYFTGDGSRMKAYLHAGNQTSE